MVLCARLTVWVCVIWARGSSPPSFGQEASNSLRRRRAFGGVEHGRSMPGAQGLVQHAQELAERGAVYSAQTEFVQALKLVAQSLDAARRGDACRCPGRGLAGDDGGRGFCALGCPEGNGMDLSRLIAMHRTPLLKQADASQLTPLRASQALLLLCGETTGDGGRT